MVRSGLRARFAGDIDEAIKQVALEQLAEGGPGAISVNAIGRRLQVSGPALYRYYASRDELLTDLILDAYADLAAALETSDRASAPVQAYARAYRAWALEQPHRYRLLYAPPLPGYDAHDDQLVAAAQRVMDLLLDALSEEAAPAPSPPPWPDGVSRAELAAWTSSRRAEPHQAYALQAVVVWTRLHGLTRLEVDGNFASIGVDPSALYAREVASVATTYPTA